MTTKQPNIPQSLPMLPGFTKQDPTLTHFHKAQIFNTTVGETHKMGDVQVDNQLLQSLRDGTATTFNAVAKTMIPPRQGVENDAIPKAPPKWLKHDREVLRFNAFFQEPVHENADENYRLRKCFIYYHLDDDTMYVTEPKIQNSGIPQGVFLKRHKVPKKQNSREHYTWQDVNIGMNIEIYGRVFRIYDCDQFTRSFYVNNMVSLNPAEQIPLNPFDTTRFKANLKVPPADAGEHKEYIEVKLGGGHPNRNLNRYMNNDRKVLSFMIQWNDTSYDGGLKYYTLNYFLSDGTIEVKEVIEQNCGRDPFPMMLKRQKLAKKAIMTHYPGMSLKKEDYYQPVDLNIGSTVDVHGRQCLIYDCDEFTKQWLKDNLGKTVQGLKLGVASSFSKAQPIPNYNGFGTEQDSLGSVFSLQPKPPRKDVNKMFKSDMHILRFEAKLVSPDSDDETRKFMIMFYCGDDTIQVTEICEKNSGRIGGKFMERKKHKHPFNDKRYMEERDFQIGELVMLGGFKFRLSTADEYTLKYMEDNPEVFPGANVHAIIGRIKRGYNKFGSIEDYCQHLMKILDTNQDGFISFEEFKTRLESLDTYLTHHEMTTLVRAFDRNNDGKISLPELVETIKAC